MKRLALLMVVFLLHVEADEKTQVGIFDAGVSSEKIKITKRQKAPIEEAKTYKIDINDSEVEGIITEPSAPLLEKKETIKLTKKQPPTEVNIQNAKSDVSQRDGGGVVLPFDKVDDNSGVVLPMDEEKKGGFFSIFGF